MSSIFSHPDVRMMTYNLKNGGDLPHWERRKFALAETIRQQHPTIIGTQEGLEFQLAFLRDELQHYEVHGEGRVPLLGDEYCAVFVDKRIAEVKASGTFWLSPTPQVPGSRMQGGDLPRIATWVRMTVHGISLLYVNTHLTFVEDDIPAQMAVLVQELNKLIDPTVETIITGDFNIGRHRQPITALQALGFTDVWSIARTITGPIFTFPDWRLWDDTALETVTDENRIDWVCIRPADGESTPPLQVSTVQTHRQEPVPSDHFPVVVSGI